MNKAGKRKKRRGEGFFSIFRAKKKCKIKSLPKGKRKEKGEEKRRALRCVIFGGEGKEGSLIKRGRNKKLCLPAGNKGGKKEAGPYGERGGVVELVREKIARGGIDREKKKRGVTSSSMEGGR